MIFPILQKKLTADVHNALNLWHKSSAHGCPFEYLYLYQRALRNGSQNVRSATNHVLNQAIDLLTDDDKELSSIIAHRFPDDLSAQVVGNKMNMVEGTVYKKQRYAIERLAELLDTLERSERKGYLDSLEARIEQPSYQKLLGVEEPLDELAGILTDPESPNLICIEGMGGIGKTSLANGLIRRMMQDGQIGWGIYADLGWITARQSIFNAAGAIKKMTKPALTVEALGEALCEQLLPNHVQAVGRDPVRMLVMLKERLKSQPHLIVVDNLETMVDIESLIETLRDLANPTRFLLTTRQSLFGEPNVYHYNIPAMSEATALELVRLEAKERNLPHLATADDAELHPIYETVGGNPLALRLIVGQTHIHALGDVLDDLSAARGEKIEHLYTYIFRHAWDNLDEATRKVLLLMPLVTEEGADLDFLTSMGQVDKDQLRHGLDRLVTLNLVDSRGGLHERRYTIHSLTRTFLQEQVLRWK